MQLELDRDEIPLHLREFFEPVPGPKPKDALGIPWMTAFALRADGWYLRSAITWCKGNPMPESVTDRPTSATEMVFLLSKAPRYYYDADAIREPHSDASLARYEYGLKVTPNPAAIKGSLQDRLQAGIGNSERMGDFMNPAGRNKRNWWLVNSHAFPAAHFATFSPKLIEPCILAGAPVGGVVLDPFAGAGTTGLVAKNLNRQAILIELSPDYCRLIVDRLRQDVFDLAAIS